MVKMSARKRNEFERLQRYVNIEWGINNEYRKSLNRIKYATTYEEVEGIVKSFKSLVEVALKRVRTDLPEFYYESRKAFTMLLNSLKTEAQKRINEIASIRLRRI